MATIILGGWGGGNWTPMLLPIIALLLLVFSAERLMRFIKSKLHNRGHKS